MTAALADAPAFRGLSLRGARSDDEVFLFALHRDAMRDYVAATWGWDEAWQRANFAATCAPERQAVIVRGTGTDSGPGRDVGREVGRLSVTRHWRKILLRDIELLAAERNRGVGTAIVAAVLKLARESDRYVELRVLSCNPAQRLYTRMGFKVIDDDGARLRMCAL